MAKTLQINELTNRIAAPPQFCSACTGRRQWSYSVIAVIKMVALNLGLKMAQFLSKNIDVSKSYGQNATDE
jgi:hypothetical protein